MHLFKKLSFGWVTRAPRPTLPLGPRPRPRPSPWGRILTTIKLRVSSVFFFFNRSLIHRSKEKILKTKIITNQIKMIWLFRWNHFGITRTRRVLNLPTKFFFLKLETYRFKRIESDINL